MSNNLLKVGARDEDGNANSLSVNNRRILKTTGNEVVGFVLGSGRLLEVGSSIESDMLERGNNGYGNLYISATRERYFTVEITYYSTHEDGNFHSDTHTRVIYDPSYNDKSRIHAVSYPLLTSHYKLKITGRYQDTQLIETYEIKSDQPMVINKKEEVPKPNLKEITFEFDPVQPNEYKIIDLVPEKGQVWDIKFMTVEFKAGEGNLSFQLRLGRGDVINEFVRLRGSGSIEFSPSGLLSGKIEKPYQFSDNKDSQLIEHINNIAYVGSSSDTTNGRLIMSNYTDEISTVQRVRLYVKEMN